MRCTLLASLAVATALTAATSARAEDAKPETPKTTAPGGERATSNANDAKAADAEKTAAEAAPAQPAAGTPSLPATTPSEAALFSPRLLVPTLGVAAPTDPRLDLREPRGFLGTRTTHLAVGWSLVGTGVLSGVAAGTLAWQASRPEQTPTTAPVGTSSRDDRAQQSQERADKRAMANVMAGAGLAFLATGGLTLLTAPAPRGGPNTRVGAMATPSGGYVGVTGKW